MNLNSNYIEKNLIAYIGNKRRLLPLIENAIEKTGVLNSKKDNFTFLDLFAGSGSVSRLAKNLGFETHTNDWEFYSYIMNKAFLELDADFLKNSFKKFNGIANVVEILNNLTDLKEEDKYISKFYCPEDDKNPDVNNERMFYTNFNGKKIDVIRAKIDEWKNNDFINEDEKTLLLALLIYEASTRSNTSGVFKGFHRGFGGTNGDALGRILKKLELSVPALINGKKCSVYREDAVSLSEKMKMMKFDVVYLDPPYNQHQYGSNYHLLNTIALNDKPSVNKEIFIDGKKVNKSAIRRDWVKTKSSFCYKDTAKEDFKNIIKNINADHILVSYSSDGIIPFTEMLEILSSKGKLDIVLSEYVKFRGGKQALTTEVRNIEFVIMVDTTKIGCELDIINIENSLCINRSLLLMKKTINPILAESVGFEYRNKVISKMNIEKILFKKYENHKIEYLISKNKIMNHYETLDKLMNLPPRILENVLNDLEYITNLTKEDEISLSINEIYKYYLNEKYEEAYDTFKNVPYLLSKFNNKKAFSLSLKTIINLLKMLNKTTEVWIEKKLLSSKEFIKLEKIIFLKLNYEAENENEVSMDKKIISQLYEMFLDAFEENKIVEKKTKIVQKVRAKVR
jgi:adenine-specific DNA-methyltransferase